MSQKLKTWFWVLVKYWKAAWPFVLGSGAVAIIVTRQSAKLSALEARIAEMSASLDNFRIGVGISHSDCLSVPFYVVANPIF